jgi:nitrate/nitrite-specific signal transduction histidine kinase
MRAPAAGGSDAMGRRAILWATAALAVLLVAGAAAPDTFAADPSPAAAINKAGRQRMLAQRLAKGYIMIGSGVAPTRGQTILTESLALFETQLAELKGYVPNEDVRKALTQLERDWGKYKAALAAVPTPQNAHAVYEASEAVQEHAHRLTLGYEKAAGTPTDRLVNIAGRQRMLSQRMAKFFLFKAWGVHTIAAQMELNFSRAEFSSAMHQLVNAPRTPEIHAALVELDRDWVAYREALGAPDDAAALRRAAPAVAEQSERLLEDLERLVTLYERQAGEAAR